MATIKDLSAGTWNVDASHSELGFTARHLMVTKVRGKFNEFEATATVADDVGRERAREPRAERGAAERAEPAASGQTERARAGDGCSQQVLCIDEP